jgi:hypothetical protein
MNRPFFIRLTKKGSKAAYRENLANLRRYYPDNEGTQLEYMDGNIVQVDESAEQIDKLLGEGFIDSKRINSKTTTGNGSSSLGS